MARFYGGVLKSPIPEFGAMEIELQNGGGKSLPDLRKTNCLGIHNDEVHIVPDDFFITASSPSQGQGMENNRGDRFGLQFHPEVNDSEFGKKMFEILLRFVVKQKHNHRNQTLV